MIFQEGQRKSWVMCVQLEKIILSSGLMKIQHWFMLPLLSVIHLFFDYSKNSQIHNMDFNVCVLDLQVRSHFPNHVSPAYLHGICCSLPLLQSWECYFHRGLWNWCQALKIFFMMAYHPSGSESFEGYWTVNVPHVSHYKTQTWVKEFGVHLLWKCSVQLSKKKSQIYTCSKIFWYLQRTI